MTDAEPWVIWSFEHDAWWAPDEWGYVVTLAQAGRYTEARARAIEARANIVRQNERALSLQEAEHMTHDDEAALLARMVEELANRSPFELVLNGTAAVQLAGLLQLALRHPRLDANNSRTARTVIEHVRAYFHDAPAVLEAMRQGDDPRRDLPWDR